MLRLPLPRWLNPERARENRAHRVSKCKYWDLRMDSERYAGDWPNLHQSWVKHHTRGSFNEATGNKVHNRACGRGDRGGEKLKEPSSITEVLYPSKLSNKVVVKKKKWQVESVCWFHKSQTSLSEWLFLLAKNWLVGGLKILGHARMSFLDAY